MDIFVNHLIQFYSNNATNLHHLTSHSTMVLPHKMSIVSRPQILFAELWHHFTLCIKIRVCFLVYLSLRLFLAYLLEKDVIQYCTSSFVVYGLFLIYCQMLVQMQRQIISSILLQCWYVLTIYGDADLPDFGAEHFSSTVREIKLRWVVTCVLLCVM